MLAPQIMDPKFISTQYYRYLQPIELDKKSFKKKSSLEVILDCIIWLEFAEGLSEYKIVLDELKRDT